MFSWPIDEGNWLNMEHHDKLSCWNAFNFPIDVSSSFIFTPWQIEFLESNQFTNGSG